MASTDSGARPARTPDFELSLDELRAVTAFNLACAGLVIDQFEAVRPTDERPRQALSAAADFVNSGRRSRAQRLSAPAAHRAAKGVAPAESYAAMAAGDAAASAYLHPLADAAQVGHILRGQAYCVLALQARNIEPMSRSAAEAVVLGEANATVVQVLHRYPPATSRGRDDGEVLAALDARLRVDMAGDSLRPGIGDVSI